MPEGNVGAGMSLAPEARLQRLFAREAAAQQKLAAIRNEINEARGAYARKHGLLCLPRVDRLKERFG